MSNLFFINTAKRKMKIKSVFSLRKTKNKNLRWIPFSCATEKQLALRYTSSCGSDTIISGIISTVPCCKLSNDQKNSPFLILPKKKLKRIKTFYPYWHFLQFQSPLKRWSVKLTINPAMYVSHMKYTALNLEKSVIGNLRKLHLST